MQTHHPERHQELIDNMNAKFEADIISGSGVPKPTLDQLNRNIFNTEIIEYPGQTFIGPDNRTDKVESESDR